MFGNPGNCAAQLLTGHRHRLHYAIAG
jgi:hypothetical protein